MVNLFPLSQWLRRWKLKCSQVAITTARYKFELGVENGSAHRQNTQMLRNQECWQSAENIVNSFLFRSSLTGGFVNRFGGGNTGITNA